jgi:hypothetical protein
MLHGEHTDSALGADDGDTGKAVKAFLAGFGHIAEGRMGSGFVQIERFDLFGNRANQTFAKAQFGDVDSVLIQPARRE